MTTIARGPVNAAYTAHAAAKAHAAHAATRGHAKRERHYDPLVGFFKRIGPTGRTVTVILVLAVAFLLIWAIV